MSQFTLSQESLGNPSLAESDLTRYIDWCCEQGFSCSAAQAHSRLAKLKLALAPKSAPVAAEPPPPAPLAKVHVRYDREPEAPSRVFEGAMLGGYVALSIARAFDSF